MPSYSVYQIKKNEADWETGEVRTGIWWRGLRKRDHLEDLGVEGRIVKRIFKKWDVGVRTGLI